MVNSGSFDSESDRNSKAGCIQSKSTPNSSQSSSPVIASSASQCKNGFQTADIGLPFVAHAIEPTPTKTEFNSSMSVADHTNLSLDGTTQADNTLRHHDVNDIGMVSPIKASIYCSVPLDKIQEVLTTCCTRAVKTVEDDDIKDINVKVKQHSRKLLCLYCERTFVNVSLRQKHVERCHSEKQNRRLSSRKLQSQFTTTACSYCDKLSTEHTLKQLFEHLNSEHSNKYFACFPCEDRFLNISLLNDHKVQVHGAQGITVNIKSAIDIGKEISEITNKKSKSVETLPEIPHDELESSTVKLTRSMYRAKINAKKMRNVKKKTAVLKDLRNKKISVKSSKIVLKRSKRLQAKVSESHRKKRSKNLQTKISVLKEESENSTKIVEKTKSLTASSINPYPEFDNFYRVKKITDHSIDNLKISSLTFDDVFDKAFFNRIKCNIQENLIHHIDGKLFKNEESESRISNFEKVSNIPQEIINTNTENYGCDLSLNAITPVTSLLSSQFGEDFESQIEYGCKPSKKKLQTRQDPVRHKYVTRRKYQASILEHKENRDLSKLDMWTQLVIKDRQQKVVDDKKSAKEMAEYTGSDEYKQKIRRGELNRILDRRGPFEDLKEEATKKAAFDKLNLQSTEKISEFSFSEVREVLDELLNKVFKLTECEHDNSELTKVEIYDGTEKKVDDPEIPAYLNLARSTSLPSEGEIDKSDRIALICSSQETENYELPTNTARGKNEMVQLSGEWARSRIYICAACGSKLPNIKLLLEHKSLYHQNAWVQHYEFVGNQSELYRHLCIPGLGKIGAVEDTVQCKVWRRSSARLCSKCGKSCNALAELHRHILECGGDWTWMLARKKCKYKPFGAKSRRKRRGLVKRMHIQKTGETEKKKYKKTFDGPRQRPSDADTIQRMLANLPLKRASRKIMCLKDGFRPQRTNQIGTNSTKGKLKCGKLIMQTSTFPKSNANNSKNSKNFKNNPNRRCLRSFNKVLSSRILDTNSTLRVKRKLKNFNNRRTTRQTNSKDTKNVEEHNTIPVKSDSLSIIPSNKITTKKSSIKPNIDNGLAKESGESSNSRSLKCEIIKSDSKLTRVKNLLKEKINLKNYFPVKKKQSIDNKKEIDKIEKSKDVKFCEGTDSQQSDVTSGMEVNNTNRNKLSKKFKRKFNIRKKKLLTSNQETSAEDKKSGNNETEKSNHVVSEVSQKIVLSKTKMNNKRKLRSSFKKVVNKVKKLKIDITHPFSQLDSSQKLNIENSTQVSSNPFLGEGIHEKEELPLAISKSSELLVEEKKENMDKRKIAFVNTVIKIDLINEDLPVPETIINLETTDPTDHEIENVNILTNCDDSVNQTLLTIETNSTLSDQSPLGSPSLLSPRLKGKIRKPNRGLNDCIAMLTKKAFEETSKADTCLLPINSIKTVIQENDCILRIPSIEQLGITENCVLDLSKPKQETEKIIETEYKPNEENLPKLHLCNSVDEIIEDVVENRLSHPTSNVLTVEKPILKIPKFTDKKWIDDVIQSVIDNNTDTSVEMMRKKVKKEKILLPVVPNTVDEIIEQVINGIFPPIFVPQESSEQFPEIAEILKIHESSEVGGKTKTYKFENVSIKINEVDSVLNERSSPVSDGTLEIDKNTTLNTAFIDYFPENQSVIEGRKIGRRMRQEREKRSILKLDHLEQRRISESEGMLQHKTLYLETDVDNLFSITEVANKVEEINLATKSKLINCSSDIIKHSFTEENEPEHLENKLITLENVINSMDSDSEDDLPLTFLKRKHTTNVNKLLVEAVQNTSEGKAPNIGSACELTIQVGKCGNKMSISSIMDKRSEAVDKIESIPPYPSDQITNDFTAEKRIPATNDIQPPEVSDSHRTINLNPKSSPEHGNEVSRFPKSKEQLSSIRKSPRTRKVNPAARKTPMKGLNLESKLLSTEIWNSTVPETIFSNKFASTDKDIEDNFAVETKYSGNDSLNINAGTAEDVEIHKKENNFGSYQEFIQSSAVTDPVFEEPGIDLSKMLGVNNNQIRMKHNNENLISQTIPKSTVKKKMKKKRRGVVKPKTELKKNVKIVLEVETNAIEEEMKSQMKINEYVKNGFNDTIAIEELCRSFIIDPKIPLDTSITNSDMNHKISLGTDEKSAIFNTQIPIDRSTENNIISTTENISENLVNNNCDERNNSIVTDIMKTNARDYYKADKKILEDINVNLSEKTSTLKSVDSDNILENVNMEIYDDPSLLESDVDIVPETNISDGLCGLGLDDVLIHQDSNSQRRKLEQEHPSDSPKQRMHEDTTKMKVGTLRIKHQKNGISKTVGNRNVNKKRSSKRNDTEKLNKSLDETSSVSLPEDKINRVFENVILNTGFVTDLPIMNKSGSRKKIMNKNKGVKINRRYSSKRRSKLSFDGSLKFDVKVTAGDRIKTESCVVDNIEEINSFGQIAEDKEAMLDNDSLLSITQNCESDAVDSSSKLKVIENNIVNENSSLKNANYSELLQDILPKHNSASQDEKNVQDTAKSKSRKIKKNINKISKKLRNKDCTVKNNKLLNNSNVEASTTGTMSPLAMDLYRFDFCNEYVFDKSEESGGNKKLKNKHKRKRIRKKLNISVRHDESSLVNVFSPAIAEERIESGLVDTLTDTFPLESSDLRESQLDIDAPVETVLSKPTDLELADKLARNSITKSKTSGFEQGINENKEHLSPGTKDVSENVVISNFSTIGRKTRKRGKMENNKLVNCNESPIVPKHHYSETSIDLSTAESNNSSGETVNSSISSRIEQSCYSVPRSDTVETMLNSLSHAIETVDVDLGGRRRMSRSAKTRALENVLEEVLFQWKIDTMNDGGRKNVNRNAKSKALENILENALFQAKIDEHLEGIENTDDSEQLSASRIRRNTNKRTQLKYSKLGELTEPSIIYTSQSCVNSFDLPVAENSYSFNDKQNVDDSHNIIHETSSLQDLTEPKVNDASARDSIEIITNNRRNRRARKIESYNENDLAEAIFVKNPEKKIADRTGTMTKKPIIAKSKLNLINTTKQESPTITCNKHLSNGSDLAVRHSALGLKFEGDSKLEKKLDSDELFDLIKPTTPENSNIVKPRNTFLGTFEISNDFNDDNFDNVFENILENSVAPIHEDLSNSSKQLDSRRIDLYEFTESNSFEKDIVGLRKNTSKFREADDIEESIIRKNIDVRQHINKCQKKDYPKSNKRKPSRTSACLTKQNNYEVSDSSSNSDLKLDISAASSKHTPNIDSKPINDHAAIKDEKNKHMRITLENKIESCHEGIQSICLICNKSFKRVEVLLKHKTTLTHISRLSEIEAKEAKSSEAPNFSDEDEDSAIGKHNVGKSKNEITLHDMLQRSERLPEGDHTAVAPSYSPTTNQSPKQSLKLADIITDVLNKPSMDKDKSSHNLSDIIMQNSKDIIEYPEYRRYKSLGERKSFDSDQSISITDSISPKRAIDPNYYDPQIANNAGTILEKQISLLQNMIENTSGLKYIEEISLSSTHSGPRNQGSPLSIISSKHEDSSNILFPNNCLAVKKTQENFLKPSQLEEISEDSVNARNCDDQKTRKVLNRDEELFLECCSLLKSGSEVSNYSKKSNKIHSVLNNLDLKVSDEPDWLEPKSFPEKHLIEDLSDVSRIPTPLGDSFADDDSNSNTISSNWDMHKDLMTENNTNNKTCEVPTGKNFTFKEAIASQQKTDFDISHKHTKINSILTKVITNPFKRDSKILTERETSIEIISKPKVDALCRMVDKKMPTKGALKIFEGLKVSIPTEELNLEEVFNCSRPLRRIESNNTALKKAKTLQLRSIAVEKATRKSKPIKNKSRSTSKFGFNIKKQVVQKSVRKIKRTLSQCNSQLHDVYDFEETQDNTEVFAKPDYRSFRNKTTDEIKSESDLESRDNTLGVEGNSLSSTSSHSNISTKITNNQEAITKKKCMIMGRIFKNALKPKLDEEIKEIPMLDHNELVENYVLSCPKVDKGFRRPKMSEQEMNMLFDKLLDDAVPSGDKSADTNQKSKESKTALQKRKTKTKNKKRQRSNSDSTDDEFGLNKMSKKRIYKKNTKVVDNCINLEQELKECIGVASRKSQRKCTSGKQNVLVEYWSSDDSAFEAFLEGHLQEITNNSETQSKKPISESIHVTETNQHQVLLPIVEQVSIENIQTDDTNLHPIISKDTTFVIKENKKNKNKKKTCPAAISRRKRVAADPLYHWSSSSEDEFQGLMEVKAVRDDPEDDDEDRPVQHGWIVGDSPKKLVTMLAQAKGKKTDVDCVKEQGKKKNGNMNS